MIISFATLKPETWYFSITRNFTGSLTPTQDYKIVMWRRIEPRMDPPEVKQLDIIKQNMEFL